MLLGFKSSTGVWGLPSTLWHDLFAILHHLLFFYGVSSFKFAQSDPVVGAPLTADHSGPRHGQSPKP